MAKVTRRLQSLNNRVFNRVTRPEIRDALISLGVSAGDTLYASVSMRGLGYVPGGPAEVIGAILDVIGSEGTLVMPTWPAADPARRDPEEAFDVAETPSKSGLLSEALRTFAGSRRSVHPVAPVSAIGARAAEVTAGHDIAPTPFGPSSPYARLFQMSPALLLVGTQMGGLLYHLMDKVAFPNLYRSEPCRFEVRDAKGSWRTMNSVIPRDDVPPVVILPGSRPENRDYLLVADYALMFPGEREQAIMEAGYLRFNRSRFLGRRERLQARGILRQGRVGAAESVLLDGTRMLDQIAKDLAWDIARFKEEYDAEQLALLSLPIL